MPILRVQTNIITTLEEAFPRDRSLDNVDDKRLSRVQS